MLHSRLARALALAVTGLALLAPTPVAADSHDPEAGRAASGSGELQPTQEPTPPQGRPIYTTDYLFALTRLVANSTLVPAARVPIFFFTIPIDAALLPVAAVAGFFPGGPS